MELLFMFLLGILFNYILQCIELIIQWFQMWVSLKVSKIQVEINKLADSEHQDQGETFAVGFHAPEPDYYDDEDIED